MFHVRISLFIILLSTALISACGGGGGGGAGGGGTPDVNAAPVANDQELGTDENTALEITLTGTDADGDSLSFTVSTNPTNGTLSGTAPDLTYTPNVDYTGSDSFTFSANDGTADSAEATISITVNNTVFSIGGTVTGAVNSGLTLENNGGDSLEVGGIGFAFPTQLSVGSSYEVTLAGLPEHQLCAVSNASGTVATADVDDVSVLCRYWRTAAPIETDAGAAGSPQIAFDNNDNAIAVWIQNDGTYDSVWANTWSPTTGWGTPVNLESQAGDALTPEIAFDSAGNATVVWAQYSESSSFFNLWTSRYTPGGGWSTAGFIEYNEGDVTDPQIAVDSSGNAIVVWSQNDTPAAASNPSNIWAIVFTSGVGWGTAEKIETSGVAASVPQVAFDSNGNALAVWHQYDGITNYDIMANLWESGSGNWNTAVTIESNDDGNSWNPQVVVNSSDQATIVWSGNDGSQFNIWARTYSFVDDELGAEELIETDNAGNAYNPQIAVDSDGTVIAVWRQHDGTRYNSWANIYSPGGGWGTAQLIETNSGSAGQQQIAFDNLGNAIAIWRSGDILANTWSPEFGWGVEIVIDTENEAAANPQIAIDSTGNAIVVWNQNDNILSNHFE